MGPCLSQGNQVLPPCGVLGGYISFYMGRREEKPRDMTNERIQLMGGGGLAETVVNRRGQVVSQK